MSIPNRWDALVQESGGTLPSQLKQFQIDTQTLLEAGRHALVSAATGAGKTIIIFIIVCIIHHVLSTMGYL